MSTHPSEDFVANYLEMLGWTIRQNLRVKLKRNWTDLDLLATPLGGATAPVWAGSQPMVPQVVQVKWRAVFGWNLAGDPGGFTDYAWPERHHKVLRAAGDLCGGPFDWVFLSTNLWIPADPSARPRVEQHALSRLSAVEPRLRAVHLRALEDVCDDWLVRHAERTGGWADDPFTFLTDLLARSSRLRVSDAIAASFQSTERLAGLHGTLAAWKGNAAEDLDPDGALAGVHRWLVAVADGCGSPGAATFPYSKSGVRAIYALLSKEDGYWIGVERWKDGSMHLAGYWNDKPKPAFECDLSEHGLPDAEAALLTWMRTGR